MLSAIKVTPADNVAVAIEPISGGDEVSYAMPDGTVCTIRSGEDITIYHKLSTCDIRKGESIVKYGEVIGIASQDIPCGMHVHTHNVISEQELKGGQHKK